jgi:uncharacterized protein (DUF1015 family)
MKCAFAPADILLPDFGYTDGTKWAIIACDQFTSQPEYWKKAAALASGAPSALNLILPEAYLGEEDARLPQIARSMDEYLKKNVLHEHKNTMIYLERTQPDGRVRRGIVGAVDLECYDWHPGTETLIRATEGTVPERIPPRVRIRKSAPLELPHVMLLVDDPAKNIVEYFDGHKGKLKEAYDFDLMLGGGHVHAWFIDSPDDIAHVENGILALSAPDAAEKKYGVAGKQPLAIAVGDGNHSLATAKAVYEEVKEKLGVEAAKNHPARWALAELVNIHDTALDFEPIYRVVFGADPKELTGELKKYCTRLNGGAVQQKIRAVYGKKEEIILIDKPEHQLTVGTLQRFLDMYMKVHKGAKVDYIHGEDEAVSLAGKPGVTAFIFDGMTKDDLFRSVLCDGALPRKTFSMGHAEDKRYYIEARKIN